MKIKNFKNYNLNLQKVKQLFKQIQSQKEIKTNQEQNNSLVKQDDFSHSSANIFSPGKNLDQSLETILLKTWIKMNLPLKKEYINKLINYINIKNNMNPESLIKAFGFLIKNNLPLLPELIEGMARNFNSQQSLSKLLNSSSLQENNPRNNNSSPTDIKNKLIFKLDQPPSELAKKLKNYPRNLKQIINLLKNGKNSSKKLVQYLLGQQLLNLPENKQENNHILTLELPVIFKEKDDPLPLHLQIKRENQKNKKKTNNKTSFKISFIIDLEKRGSIKADIVIYSNYIQCQFTTTSSKTARIIESTFPLLKKRLENLKFKVEDPLIKQVKDEKKFNNKSSFESSPEQPEQIEKFVHFNFKI